MLVSRSLRTAVLVLLFVPACSLRERKCDRLFATFEASQALERTLVRQAKAADSLGGSEITPKEQAEIDPLVAQVNREYDAWVAAGCARYD